MAKKPLNVHVFSHTRWDREGRRTLSELRLHTVFLLEELIGLFRQVPAQMSVVLDGQAVILEDYLAVRPQNVAAVTEAVQTGKLHVGPWYVMPHQELASPEALIRNLLLGTQMAAQFGSAFQIGYMPDAYSYVGQMPQVLRGFGIDSAVVSLDPEEEAGCHRWVGPDGSSLLSVNLRPELSLNATSSDTLKRALARARDRKSLEAPGHEVFIRIAVESQREAVSVAEAVGELDGKLRSVKVTLDDLLASIRDMEEAGPVEGLPAIGGLPVSRVSGSLSNRVLLKLRNRQIETLVEFWVEPFSAWAWMLRPEAAASGRDTLTGPGQVSLDMTRHLWKTLVQNHNQATLGGCATDGVYQEALLRFDQAEQLGEELATHSLQEVAGCVSTALLSADSNPVPVIVFNASNLQRVDLVSVRMVLPDPAQRLALVDHAGAHVPYELLRDNDETCLLRFVAADVPARGYKTYFLCASDQEEAPPGRRDEERTIENEFLTVTFDRSTGMLDVFDKRTGRSFSDLNHFVDQGDCGTLQEFETPVHDTVIDIATNTPIFVEREISQVEQTLTFLQIYRLPRQLTEQRDARLPLAAQFVPVSIVTQVKLVPGVARVDITASIANDALDHRLMVRFGFGSDLQKCLVDSPFEIQDYTSTFDPSRRGRKTVSLTTAQRAFVTLWGSDTGLTIANFGLPEVTITQQQNGVDVALTLIRSAGRLQMVDAQVGDHSAKGYIDTPDGQCLGDYTFRYSVIPHGQDVLSAWHEAWAIQTPLRALVTDIHEGTLPPQASLIRVDNPKFVVSAVKTGEDGQSLVVRGYNISSETETVTVTPGMGDLAAQRTRINEIATEDAIQPDGSGGFVFDVRPAEIVTIRLDPHAS